MLPFFTSAHVQNYGVSLGMLSAPTSADRWGLVGLTSAIALVVLVWMMRERSQDQFALG